MKQFGLIGYPLKNSFSENYFNSKFLKLGLMDYVYQNFAAETVVDIEQLLSTHPNLKGFNITIPHKENIIPLLDKLDESAAMVGAVNCVNITSDGKRIGYNTDVYGFKQSLLPLIENKTIKNALILGTGGAAKAVAYVLQKLHISYTYVSRKPGKNQYAYEELTETIVSNNHLIINCTPLGMFPTVNEAPAIPYLYITAQHLIYDLIYLPIETSFLQQCKQQGATTKNGLEMLHLQADKSWEIWQHKF